MRCSKTFTGTLIMVATTRLRVSGTSGRGSPAVRKQAHRPRILAQFHQVRIRPDLDEGVAGIDGPAQVVDRGGAFAQALEYENGIELDLGIVPCDLQDLPDPTLRLRRAAE